METGVRECFVNGQPCEVLGDLTAPDAALAMVREYLPCSWCRVAERDLAGLARVRLGKHERRILLAAPGPAAHPLSIEPERAGRSADEAQRRAIRRLAEHGLVERWYYARLILRLTPLGAAVVAAKRFQLEAGQPIRWQKEREQIAGCRKKTPTLSEQFRAAVEAQRVGLEERCQPDLLTARRERADWLESTYPHGAAGERQRIDREIEQDLQRLAGLSAVVTAMERDRHGAQPPPTRLSEDTTFCVIE